MDANPLSSSAGKGTPDWQGLRATEHYDVLTAYQDPQLFFALPKLARLAPGRDGLPDFFLEFFSDRNDPEPDNSLYAMLGMGLEVAGPPADARSAVPEKAALLHLAPAGGNYFHLESGDTHESLPFCWDGARRATINARISLATARLLYGALAGPGMTVLCAALECEVPALLPRLDLTVRGNTRSLLHAVCDELRVRDGCIPFAALVSFLSESRPQLLQCDGGATAGTPLGLALAGRLRQALGRFAPCRRLGDGPLVAFDLDAPERAIAWDLRTPLLAGVPVFVNCAPFYQLAAGVTRERLARFTRIPSLPDELRSRRVTVASALPEAIINCAQVGLSLQVDKKDAESGMASVYPLEIYPSDRRSWTVDLRYARTGVPKSCSAVLQVVYDDGAIVEAPVPDGGDYLLLDQGLAPLQCLQLRASPELLQQAEISFTVSGDPALTQLSGALTTTRPGVALLASAPPQGARWNITAREPGKRAAQLQLELPCRSLELDLAAFHQYGAQSVPVTIHFDSGAAPVRLEFQPEAPDTEPITLEFSPAAPTGRLSYFATSLFHSGYRYRRAATADGPQQAWSALQAPGTELTLHV